MITTVLFDLDGTLLPMRQEHFVDTYLGELSKVFAQMGHSPEKAVKALWAGTAAMMKNDGSTPNSVRFWGAFATVMGVDEGERAKVEAACDDFYGGAFNNVKRIVRQSDAPGAAVRALRQKGYTLALATSPLFPPQAVESRLDWVGLKKDDFALCTDYTNIGFCKNNPGYYAHVLEKLAAKPENCLMVGNSLKEDMCAAKLGMDTYLVTGYVEMEEGDDISAFRQGSIEDFALFASQMPDLRG